MLLVVLNIISERSPRVGYSRLSSALHKASALSSKFDVLIIRKIEFKSERKMNAIACSPFLLLRPIAVEFV